MSYLSDLIERFNKSFNPSDLFDELIECTKANDIMIHNEKTGDGIFIVKGRKHQKRIENGRLKATVSRGKDVNQDVNSEVSLSRALFNADRINLPDNGTNGEPRQMELISFEAPLLRRSHGIGKREIKCDLIGIEKTEKELNIFAIEVKNRAGKNTNISYAIPEAFAYGIVLGKYLMDENMKKLVIKQINAAQIWKSRELKKEDIEDKNCSCPVCHVYPIVLAPRDYWKTQLSSNETLEKYQNLKEMFTVKLNDENLSSCLSMPSYWVLPSGEVKFDDDSNIPELKKLDDIQSYNSLEEVKRGIYSQNNL
ncbi:MAG: hypothetical protein GX445_04865 [Elusimicrobia bacterium]|nr:hypothetical protein [Elusimicrobiota bacterium]